MNLADAILVVQAAHPLAAAEWPDRKCSISEYPRGPEISGRYSHPTSAWLDADRQTLKFNPKPVHQPTGEATQ